MANDSNPAPTRSAPRTILPKDRFQIRGGPGDYGHVGRCSAFAFARASAAVLVRAAALAAGLAGAAAAPAAAAPAGAAASVPAEPPASSPIFLDVQLGGAVVSFSPAQLAQAVALRLPLTTASRPGATRVVVTSPSPGWVAIASGWRRREIDLTRVPALEAARLVALMIVDLVRPETAPSAQPTATAVPAPAAPSTRAAPTSPSAAPIAPAPAVPATAPPLPAAPQAALPPPPRAAPPAAVPPPRPEAAPAPARAPAVAGPASSASAGPTPHRPPRFTLAASMGMALRTTDAGPSASPALEGRWALGGRARVVLAAAADGAQVLVQDRGAESTLAVTTFPLRLGLGARVGPIELRLGGLLRAYRTSGLATGGGAVGGGFAALAFELPLRSALALFAVLGLDVHAETVDFQVANQTVLSLRTVAPWLGLGLVWRGRAA
jgi:hypothetical protein